MNKKRNIIISIILIIIAVLFTYLVKNFDVKFTDVNGTNIGFSTINLWFNKLVGTNMGLYKLTNIVGVFPILIVVIYGLIGISQLIKGKSLKKVNNKLIILGCFYVIVLLVYIFFEKFIINYRPVIIDEGLEASYPSSHTMLALCFCASSILISKNIFKENIAKKLNIASLIIMFVLVLGRTFSGVHWLTDIIGGMLISSALIMIFYTTLNAFSKNKIIN